MEGDPQPTFSFLSVSKIKATEITLICQRGRQRGQTRITQDQRRVVALKLSAGEKSGMVSLLDGRDGF